MSNKAFNRLICLMSCLFLVGCTEVVNNTPRNIEKKHEQKLDENTTKKKEVINHNYVDIGFIESVDSNSLSLARNGKVDMIYDIKTVDKEKLAKLKVGQKIKVYRIGVVLESLPGQSKAIDVEIQKDLTSHLTEEAPAQIRPISENGITIKTDKAEYPTSVKTIILKIKNDSTKEYMTGEFVFLEKKVKDTWYKFPYKTNVNVETEKGVIHPPNESSSLSLNVDDLRYKLTPGKYRATISGLAASFKIVE